ncbi:uncharacterized protein LOC134686193 isoform X2 [Mytilus trossulus]|uniref:uncharacterized protein LOC134686193 isoform X2 n=1 Tax=Mytilus trossulus TaxID=6551 RepID=UPI00300502B7
MLLGIFVTISLFGLVRSDQCSTSVSNFQIANFGNANLDVDSYIKISQSLSEMKQTTLRMEQKLHRMYSDVNRTCQCDSTTFIPHPNKCQLYYNCSQALSPLPTENRKYTDRLQVLRPAYLHECLYPKLFSTTTMSCQYYKDVKCGSRYETKNKCNYLAISYTCLGACKECIYFTPDCEGFADGVYDNMYILHGYYFECRDERNIYGGANPCKTNMAPHNGECRDLFEIPTTPWGVGNGIACNSRQNGNYRSERMGRCDIYYTCVNGNTTLSHCSNGQVFDSKTSFCQNPANACAPCGSFNNGC